MKVKIEFEIPEGGLDAKDEANWVLTQLAVRIGLGMSWPTKVMDINGNSIGTVEVSDE